MSVGPTGYDPAQARTRDAGDEGSIPSGSTSKPRKKRKLPKIISASEADRLLTAARQDGVVTEEERIRNALALEFIVPRRASRV